MERSKLFFCFLFSTIVLFSTFGCGDRGIENMVTSPEVESSPQLSKSNKDAEIAIIDPVTDAFPCNIRIEESWEFKNYEPKPGKSMGIWPAPNPNGNIALWQDYRTRWGFTQIIVQGAGVQLASSAGYSTINTMFGLSGNLLLAKSYVLDNNAGYYYYDEVLERQLLTKNEVIALAQFILDNRSTSKLYLGSYAYTPNLYPEWDYRDIISAKPNTYLLCDWYDNGTNGNIGPTFDQRNVWEGFRYVLGSRNPSNWIHSRRDYSEFSQLIGKAMNLGMNSMWFFIGEDGTASNVDAFCWNAWKKGFLRRFDQRVKKYYKCIENNCATCSEGGTWILYNTLVMEIKEVF